LHQSVYNDSKSPESRDRSPVANLATSRHGRAMAALSDAELARRLQEEENARTGRTGRTWWGGGAVGGAPAPAPPPTAAAPAPGRGGHGARGNVHGLGDVTTADLPPPPPQAAGGGRATAGHRGGAGAAAAMRADARYARQLQRDEIWAAVREGVSVVADDAAPA